MTSYRVKWAGAWVPLNNPHARIKVQWANTWREISAFRYRWGNRWYDPEWLGFPPAPETPTLWKNTWDPTNDNEDKSNTLTVRWGKDDRTGPQANIVQYDIRLRGAAGALIVQKRLAEQVPGPQEWTFANLQWDTRYRIDARAISEGGYEGDWSGELHINTGHPAQNTTSTVDKTRAWERTVQVNMYRDQFYGPLVPPEVTANKIGYDLATTFSTSYISDPGSSRTFFRVVNGDQVGYAFDWANPIRTNYDIINQQGQNKRFGGVLRGTGWSTEGVSNTWRVTGTITVYGTETYTDTVTTTVKALPPFEW